ncbi:MAG: cyclase family protein [Pyrinomonadaceae bacterium]|nr:cyclase family protein [Pyrinomonadaceae bacterium]MCX7639294.1 cyclase family protein [Pyrinomonadaceae bacterium]MDW8303484.1 cyclase family protein [Acidobacteriota bacterium]
MPDFNLFDLSAPISIAIPLLFDGKQPNAYGVERASIASCRAGRIIGDTRLGGSCNFSQIKLIPHCNGTHTECVGHITYERIAVYECLKDVFITALLISVTSERADRTSEDYPIKNKSDELITRKALLQALQKIKYEKKEAPKALIVRTLPNDESKLERTYLNEIPPFFSLQAMEFIASEFDHLLVDLPSIDRLFDEGRLTNHRIFWNVPQGSFRLASETKIHKTVTEMIYVPNEVEDGVFLLNLQITAFDSEATPSRPLIFRFLNS